MNDTSTILSKGDVTATPKCEDTAGVNSSQATEITSMGDATTQVERVEPKGDTTMPKAEATEFKESDDAKTAIADNLPSATTSTLDDATKVADNSTTLPVEERDDANGDAEPEVSHNKRRVGKIVAGAVGGVLLGSVAAYAAINGFDSDEPSSSKGGDKSNAEANLMADADTDADTNTNTDTDNDANAQTPDENGADANDGVVFDDSNNADGDNGVYDDILQVMDDDEEYVEGERDDYAGDEGATTNVADTIDGGDDAQSFDAQSGEESSQSESNTEEPAEPTVDEPSEDVGDVDLPIAEDEVIKVGVAHGVNDDMSFNEAFATARAEVGAGGVFEWRGNIYGTYYADEWNEMSDDEREAFSEGIDLSADDTKGEDDLVVEDDDEVVDALMLDDEDDGDTIEVLGIADDDADMDALVDDDDSVVFVDVDAWEDDVDGDLMVEVAADDIYVDDIDVVESLSDDADDMAWGGDDLFA